MLILLTFLYFIGYVYFMIVIAFYLNKSDEYILGWLIPSIFITLVGVAMVSTII